jgi:hypothetical protein
MRRYYAFVILFVVALISFFAGSVYGNLTLLSIGVAGVLALFFVRRVFLPRD